MAEINRLVWEKGDFGAVAHMGWDVGEVVVGHVGVRRGEQVVDVALARVTRRSARPSAAAR